MTSQQVSDICELIVFHGYLPLSHYEEALAFLKKFKAFPRKKREAWSFEITEWQRKVTEATQTSSQSTATAATTAAAAVAQPKSEVSNATSATGENVSSAFTSPSPSSALSSSSTLQPSSAPASAASSKGWLHALMSVYTSPPLTPYLSSLLSSSQPHSLVNWPSSSTSSSTSSSSSSSSPSPPGFQQYVHYYASKCYCVVYSLSPRLAKFFAYGVLWLRYHSDSLKLLIFLLLTWRLLQVLFIYFRLGNLPGVHWALQEIKNILKIAFISGSGRPLFA